MLLLVGVEAVLGQLRLQMDGQVGDSEDWSLHLDLRSHAAACQHTELSQLLTAARELPKQRSWLSLWCGQPLLVALQADDAACWQLGALYHADSECAAGMRRKGSWSCVLQGMEVCLRFQA